MAFASPFSKAAVKSRADCRMASRSASRDEALETGAFLACNPLAIQRLATERPAMAARQRKLIRMLSIPPQKWPNGRRTVDDPESDHYQATTILGRILA